MMGCSTTVSCVSDGLPQPPKAAEEVSGAPLVPQSSDELLSSGHFEMPFSMVRDGTATLPLYCSLAPYYYGV